MIELDKELPQSEMIKLKGYLESEDSGRINVANGKIDSFIKSYLKCLKYDYNINKLDYALEILEASKLAENGTDNIVSQTITQKFKEYIESRKIIKELPEGTEKEKRIRLLKVRQLWEI